MADPRDEKVVLFVGAGISTGAGLPEFKDLQAELFNDVVHADFVGTADRAKLEAHLARLAPEYTVSLLNETDESPVRYICERVSGVGFAAEHELVAAAIRDVGATVYTPNFDRLIESALPDAPVSSRTLATDEPQEASIYKLHGTCPNIFAATEEVLVPLEGPWADRFLRDCERAHLVVWGYRGADPDLTPLVLRGAARAATVTWICYRSPDIERARDLLGDDPRFVITAADNSRATSVRIAGEALRVEVPVVSDQGRRRGSGDQPHYVVQRPSTIAHALGQIGGPKLARRAWWRVLRHGARADAIKALGQSYLFDEPLAQRFARHTLPMILAVGNRPTVARQLLTALEGGGTRSADDRIVDDVLRRTRRMERIDDVLRLQARCATLLRRRGRLEEAIALIEAFGDAEQRRRTKKTQEAAWEGRLTYDEAIARRLQGDVPGARAVANLVQYESLGVFGANWAMWLEDELAALALLDEDPDTAEKHLARAQDLCDAYGRHPLAMIDLGLRTAEVRMVQRAPVDELRQIADGCEANLHTYRFVTPIRLGEVNALRAEIARRDQDFEKAGGYYASLATSPHLPHQLASTVGMTICGRTPIATLDNDPASMVGTSSLTALYALVIVGRRDRPQNSASEWLELLQSGQGLLILK